MFLALRNLVKACALLVVACAALAGVGWALGGYRGLSIFVFCGALLAAALYWYSDRVALGLVQARELPFAEAPLVHSMVERLAATLLELSRIGGWLQRALLFVLGPIAAAFVHLMLSPKREFLADQAAAAICGSPHPMADALVRLDQAAELVEFAASPATEPLYTVNPFMEEGLARMFVTHPPVAERIRRLRELDPDWREKLRAA